MVALRGEQSCLVVARATKTVWPVSYARRLGEGIANTIQLGSLPYLISLSSAPCSMFARFTNVVGWHQGCAALRPKIGPTNLLEIDPPGRN